MENGSIARCLEETAELLQAQGANPFRVQAYRKAAATVRGLSHLSLKSTASAATKGCASSLGSVTVWQTPLD